MDDKEVLKTLAVNFYSKLYSTETRAVAVFISGQFPHISDDLKHMLEKDGTMEETKRALMQISSWKAPGPDGFQAGFYKRSWDQIGRSVFGFVQDIFNGGAIREETLEALLVLVPKISKPSHIKDFRPIALCNVNIKLVNKVIADRVKVLLREMINANQSSFIPGRQSLDNVIICQEIIHSLRHTKARKEGMILELDMEKAYDRMEWSFVEETLRGINLPGSLVSMIMSLIRRSSCRLIWNGEATDSIKPTRGLRQGDPLSPYIFILCLERLSQWVHMMVRNGKWKPLKATRGGTGVSHLFLPMTLYYLQRRAESRLTVFGKVYLASAIAQVSG